MASDDPLYVRFLQRQPCTMCGRSRRGNEPWVHHRQGAGMGLRAPDRQGIPLCGDGTRGCHGALHTLTGPFKGWDKARRREWEQTTIDRLHDTKGNRDV